MNNNSSYLTFIIPTIGRQSLFDTIESIQNQTLSNWYAIIIYDGCKNILPSDFLNNNKNISIYEIEKTAGIINQASDVRNIGLKHVKTKWVAFVDDDDTIDENYVKYFFEQEKIFNFDLFIYRMIDHNFKIFPSLISKDLIPCDVGISFICKKNIFKKIKFVNSHCEDYDFLHLVKKHNYLILISNQIKYFVKSKKNIYLTNNIQLNYNNNFKVFINGINPSLFIDYVYYGSKTNNLDKNH